MFYQLLHMNLISNGVENVSYMFLKAKYRNEKIVRFVWIIWYGFFGQSALNISHWPNCMLLRFEKHLWRKLTSLKYYVLFSVNPPSIYLIDRKMCYVDYVGLFSVNQPSIFLIDRKMCYVDYVGLRWFRQSLTAVFLFWEPIWELFSVNNPVHH